MGIFTQQGAVPTRRTQMSVTPDGGGVINVGVRNSVELSDFLTRAEVDITTLSQVDRFKVFTPSSLTDPGTISLEVLFNNAGDLITLESQTDENTDIVITFANGSTVEVTGWFSGGSLSGEHDGVYSATINFRLTGVVESSTN